MPRLVSVLAAALAVSVSLVGATARAGDPPASSGQPAANASSQPTPAPAAETTALVAKVQAFYDATTTFSSPFTQEFFVKSHNVRKTSAGKVTFAKPGKMLWEYSNPAGNVVVSDGSTLKVYEAANKQMFEQNVDKSQYPAALMFLTGTGKLTDAFTFIMYPGAAMNFPGGNVLVGTPIKASPAYTKVLFYIDLGSSQVRRALILDAQGNRNRFDFTDPQVNVPVGPNTFTLTVPPNTTVTKLP